MKHVHRLLCGAIAAGSVFASPSHAMSQKIHAALPAVSPDGRQVAYPTTFSNTGDIYVMSADGSGARKIAQGGYPAWFPDGGRILYLEKQSSPDSSLYLSVVNADGTSAHRIPLQGVNGPNEVDIWRANVSPDGRWIIFDGVEIENGKRVPRMQIIGTDGKNLHAVKLAAPRATIEPQWSPDGRIAFVTWKRDASGTVLSTTLYTVNADGSNERAVASFDGRANWLSWSPDGKKIAMQHQFIAGAKPGAKTDGGIIIVDVAAGTSKIVPPHTERYVDETPAWAPDGTIFFESDRTGVYEIYRMKPDGSEQRRITG